MKKNQRGFTLVEVMVSVAIIGVLASVSVSSFKKYRAKSKIAEAKIMLAGLYTAEMMFLNEFDLFSNCLDYMGYEPIEAKNRSFAVGFPGLSANINTNVYNSAVADNLVPANCPRNLGAVENKSVFLAVDGYAGQAMDSLSEFSSSISVNSNSLNKISGPTADDVQVGLGTSLTDGEKEFVAAAAGYLSGQHNTPETCTLYTIDSGKRIRQIRPGF